MKTELSFALYLVNFRCNAIILCNPRRYLCPSPFRHWLSSTSSCNWDRDNHMHDCFWHESEFLQRNCSAIKSTSNRSPYSSILLQQIANRTHAQHRPFGVFLWKKIIIPFVQNRVHFGLWNPKTNMWRQLNERHATEIDEWEKPFRSVWFLHIFATANDLTLALVTSIESAESIRCHYAVDKNWCSRIKSDCNICWHNSVIWFLLPPLLQCAANNQRNGMECSSSGSINNSKNDIKIGA